MGWFGWEQRTYLVFWEDAELDLVEAGKWNGLGTGVILTWNMLEVQHDVAEPGEILRIDLSVAFNHFEA